MNKYEDTSIFYLYILYKCREAYISLFWGTEMLHVIWYWKLLKLFHLAGIDKLNVQIQ